MTDAAVKPTCKAEGKTEGSHCSVCGKVLVKQTAVSAVAHDYVNGICRYCRQGRVSEGLEFTPVQGGYGVSGLGTCRDEAIVIPATYNGQPVVSIEQGGLGDYNGLCTPRTIVIPDSVKTVRYNAIILYRFATIYAGKSTVFEYAAIGASGGCEIVAPATATVSSDAFLSKLPAAPFLIHRGTESQVEVTEDGFIFAKYGNEVYLCGYDGEGGDLTFPASYKGGTYKISDYAFYKQDSLGHVTLGDGVRELGLGSFGGSSVTGVDLRGRVTVLPSSCFYGCKNLTEVSIPDGIEWIQPQCFDGAGLVTVTIGRGLTKINSSAFRCENLDTLYYNAIRCEQFEGVCSGVGGFRRVVVGREVRMIPYDFMWRQSNLREVVLPEDGVLEIIGGRAFSKTSITSLKIPATVKTFYGISECTELREVIIGSDLNTNLPTAVLFRECGGTQGIDVTVKKGVTFLPACFKNCNVRSLSFETGSACKTISEGFSTDAVKNASLPASVESFDFKSFQLTTLTIHENNPYFRMESGCLIRLSDLTLLRVAGSEFTIPASVKRIAAGAFTKTGVKDLYIPDTVEEMEIGSLWCSTITSVSLPFVGTAREALCPLYELFGTTEEQYVDCHEIQIYDKGSIPTIYYVPKGLVEVTLRGDTVGNALMNLSMIKTVKLHASVKRIPPAAFYDAKAVEAICYGGTEEAWEAMKASEWHAYIRANTKITLNDPSLQ